MPASLQLGDCLITGGTGALGSAVTKAFLNAGGRCHTGRARSLSGVVAAAFGPAVQAKRRVAAIQDEMNAKTPSTPS